MLLEFGLKNYFSLKEGAVISFKLDAKVPSGFYIKKGISPVLGIKGANASGKTNILRGLTFLSIFATHSFSIPPDGLIPLAGHFDSDEPSEFFAEFTVGSDIYRYELVASDRAVIRETIYRTKAKRTRILDRQEDRITYASKSLDRLKQIKLRKNVSVISLAHQHEFEELGDIYRFFESFISNVMYDGLDLEPITESEASEQLYNNEHLRQFVVAFISECDVGVTDIKVIKAEKTDKKDRYFPAFIHGPKSVTALTESSGTRSLYRNLVRYKLALDSGSVMIADEIDIHLHPELIPKLVRLFTDPETNRRGAQLIFTTHDTAVLEILGRYRTVLVNKVDNESFAYRLDEIPGDILRNDRPISPIYLSGKIGGVPRL